MTETVDYLDLIQRARLDEEGAMDRLAEHVQAKVSVYIFRLTLDEHVAEDLCQETVMEMVKSLGRLQLENTGSFWAWIFRTAPGKVQHHYRAEQRQGSAHMSMFRERLNSRILDDRGDGLSCVAREELFRAILDGISTLKLAYRNVLVLRCFEQMPYSQIAELLGCKELRARVLFYRAKNSLKKNLQMKGYAKGTLLTALGLFGLITASAKAASSATGTVSASLIKVGPGAAIAGVLWSKLGLAMTSLAGLTTVVISLDALVYGAIFLALAVVLVICLSIYKTYD